MLDVIHYLFEEDARFTNAEEAEALSAMRTQIYANMYGQTYKYAVSSKSSTRTSANGSNDLKPYIPPTDVDLDSPMPFGSDLDSPLG